MPTNSLNLSQTVAISIMQVALFFCLFPPVTLKLNARILILSRVVRSRQPESAQPDRCGCDARCVWEGRARFAFF